MNWTFLLTIFVLVYTSAGQSVTLNMPSYSTLNSMDMRITCQFQTDDLFTIITLLNGNNNLEATYGIAKNQFEISGGTSVRLEVEPGTTIAGGSLTFVFSRITCPDFTWYVCSGRGSTSGVDVYSTNTTLQMLPRIDSLMKTSPSELVVNQISNFVCRATVRKEGPFSIQWYRRTLTTSSQIQVEQAKVIGQNECSRIVSSSLSYNVSETDRPNLVLWCRIDAGQRIDKMMNFTVQEMPTTDPPSTPKPGNRAAVILKMPSYAALNSVNLRITCEFPNGDQLGKLKLLSGNKATEVTYLVASDKFEISSDTFVSLEFNSDGSTQRGSVTFVLSRVACHDFTWYMCRWIVAQNGLTADSKNITLQGAAVILKMPSYAALNSVNLRITCEFPNGDQLGKLKLLSGNEATEVTYLVASDKFEINSDTFVSLEVNSDGSTQRSSVTFVLSRVACHDFTWYVCRWIVAKDGLTIDSKKITLQALPAIDNLMKTSSELVSNEIFNFTCKGTIQKEGPFTVQWYRKYLTSSRQLQVDQAKIIGQNECNRSIISSLTYKLRDGDEPNLILYCRIESGKIVVHKKGTFTVQG